jgi:RHS repeat-associated protein
MKTWNLSILLVLLSSLSIAQPSGNSISHSQYYSAQNSTGAISKGGSRAEIVYFDGFGMKICQAALSQSPGGQDLIQLELSDPLNRKVKSYLPYAGQLLDLSQMIQDQGLYYRTALRQAHTAYPFTEFQYDPAPNGAATIQSSPGQSWRMGSGHEQEHHYLLNHSTEVRQFISSAEGAIIDNGFYPSNSLHIKEVHDEEGTIHRIYEDAAGALIMDIRAYGSQQQTVTYYVYDRFRRLRVVIPPNAFILLQGSSPLLAAAIPADLLFRFEYDTQDRLVARHIPSEGWMEFVYDRMGRPVMSRNALQKEENKWWIQVYDKHDRLLAAGIMNDVVATSRSQWQQNLNSLQAGSLATNASGIRSASGSDRYVWPDFLTGVIWQVLILNHYDDYQGLPPALNHSTVPASAQSRPEGRLTAILSKVLDPGAASWVGESFLYDDDANIVVRLSTYPGDARLEEVMTYDLNGDMLSSQQSWTFPQGHTPAVFSAEFHYRYDHAGRIKEEALRMGGDEHTLARHNYNETGRLIESNLGFRTSSTEPLQSIDYSYNPRGWLTAINNATLSNDKASLLFSDDAESTESLAAIIFEEISLNISEIHESGEVEVLFGDSKELEFEGIQSNTLTIINSEEYGRGEWASDGLDSLAVMELQALEGEYLLLDLNSLVLSEGQNVQAILDTALARISLGLVQQGLDNPDLVLELSGAVVSYLKGKLNQAYRNDDSNDLFGMEICFEDITAPFRRFDGNVSRITWKSRSAASPGMRYDYQYDPLDRLTNAYYTCRQNDGIWTNNSEDYSLQQLSYDPNGNILALKRYGLLTQIPGGLKTFGVMDDLTYIYNANQLVSVNDAIHASVSGISGYISNIGGNSPNVMKYNAKGQLTMDPGRGIGLTYNEIGMTKTISTTQPAGQIEVVYDASGRKLRQQTTGATQSIRTEWFGNAVCRNQTLEYLTFGQGRISIINGNPRIEYELKDHLGSVRMVVCDANHDGMAEILQENHYYPFGAEMGGKTQFAGAYSNPNQFTSQELIDRNLLDWYDFGARLYDPLIGRWHSVDPLAGKHFDYTGYAYVYNNPLILIDPLGLDSIYLIDRNTRPVDNGTPGETYNAKVYVIINGLVYGPYDGSTYPNSVSNHNNSTNFNTVAEGKHSFNNRYGHKGGTTRGLNLINDKGERKTSGNSPAGKAVTMVNVNVHSGASDNGNYSSRGSHGCLTISPDDIDDFLENFTWNGNTGTSEGSLFVIRNTSASAETQLEERRKAQANPITPVNPKPVSEITLNSK